MKEFIVLFFQIYNFSKISSLVSNLKSFFGQTRNI